MLEKSLWFVKGFLPFMSPLATGCGGSAGFMVSIFSVLYLQRFFYSRSEKKGQELDPGDS